MKKILVIGDSCHDVYTYGTCNRLNPEAPVPLFVPNNNKTKVTLGMARNVFKNFLMLDVSCDILTNEKSLPTKIRYVDEVSNQMLLRVDDNDFANPITGTELESIDFDKYDAIVISDYNKGFLTYEDIMYIAERHDKVFLDTKKQIEHWCDDVNFVKVNEKEFQNNERYLTEDFPNNLIVTLGREGALYYNKNIYIKPLNRVEVRDVAGAGDTFLAAFVADYLKNDDICKAIEFANKCASYAVSQRGVVVVDLKEIENE